MIALAAERSLKSCLMLLVRRLQLAPHLPAHPQQENAAGKQQSHDLQQLYCDSREADPQGRGSQYAGQDGLFPLVLRQSGSGKPDNDRIVAGEHQVDHHDLKERC